MTSAPHRRSWPVIDRPAQTAAIVSALDSAGNRGVVVTGETGIGKTMAALTAARTMTSYPLHLHGSDTARHVPYAALAPWLSRHAPTAGLVDVAAIAAALRDAAQGLTADGVPVIVVDPAPIVDDLSAHALAQVAKAGLARLIVVGRTLADIPEPFLEMWRDRLLGHHQVEPWSTGEVADLLTRHLGAPVVLWSVQELARVAGHQPLFLRYVVDDQLARGTLTLQDGAWLLTGTPVVASAELAGVMRARLDERSEAEHRVLELVALAGEIAFDALERLVDPVALEALLETDLLEVSTGPRSRVQVRHRTIADLVRGGVPFGRRRRLRAELVDVLGEAVPDRGPALLSFAVWTLECGAELDAPVAIRAAEQANRFFDPELALTLAETVEDKQLRLPSVVQTSTALRLLGRVEQATALLTAVAAEDLSGEAPDAVCALAEELALVAAVDPAGVDAAHELLDLADALAARGPGGRRLRALRFDLLAAEGRYAEMLGELEEAVAMRDGSDEWVIAASTLMEACSLTGRQHDALALAAEVGELVPTLDLGPVAFDVAYAALFGVFMKCGLWSSSRETLQAGAMGVDLKMLLIGAAADSAIGMTYVLGGYADEARVFLGQALSQSRVRDVRRTGPQIAAGLAYAAALQGDLATARTFLLEWASGPRTYWNISASGDHLAHSARILVDGLEATEPDLLALAGAHAARGMVVDQLLLLSAAARAGSATALEALLGVDVPQPGPLVETVLRWARGIRDADAEALVEAAQQMLALGNPLFAAESAGAAVGLGGPTLARARTLAQQATAMVRGRAGASPLDGLTPREREVSERAARGDSNKEIAADLVLSVRTVESYLQSAFGKLGIRGRAELAELLAP